MDLEKFNVLPMAETLADAMIAAVQDQLGANITSLQESVSDLVLENAQLQVAPAQTEPPAESWRENLQPMLERLAEVVFAKPVVGEDWISPREKFDLVAAQLLAESKEL